MFLHQSGCRRFARDFIAALFAAIFLLQLSAGFARPLSPDAIATPHVSGDRGCCGDNPAQAQGCGDSTAVQASDACAGHCLHSGHAQSSPALIATASDISPPSRHGHAGKAVFVPQRQRLHETPRAISSTPLIYHLQRLLN